MGHIRENKVSEAEKYSNYLANRKIFTHNYELQNKLKKEIELKKEEDEMIECTFKPQLYNNKYNNKMKTKKSNKSSIYEKQSEWLNSLNKKRENEIQKKKNKEIQGCTFNPQLTSMPNYNKKKCQKNSRITNYSQIQKNKKDENVKTKKMNNENNDNLERANITFGKLNINIKVNNENNENNEKEDNIIENSDKDSNIFSILKTNNNSENENKINNIFLNNNNNLINDEKKEKNTFNKNIKKCEDEDELYEQQKKSLMKELHNWSNYDDEDDII